MSTLPINQQTLLQNEQDPLTHTPVHLLSLEAVGKNYGNIRALGEVTMAVDNGRVTCVLGDNGAGKSTLIKIIAGLHQHDEGILHVMGAERKFDSPGMPWTWGSPPSTRTSPWSP
jgi:simple sugar transport system ATP-binding protein